MALYPEQKRKLKALAHHLKPVILIGANGLTAAVQAEIDCALQAHELIKIRINSEDKALRTNAATEICTYQEADLVQTIGHIIVIYRKRKEK